MTFPSQTVFAPAKLNLFLHVRGRRRDGYHLLESLVAFADVGDSLEIEEAESFSFEISGPFSKSFEKQTGYADDQNLVVRSARLLSQIVGKPLSLKIKLIKNLPLSSGLGGGSSDAAACIWGLQNFWGLSKNEAYIAPLLLKLGADVPVCYACEPQIMRGIGEDLSPAPVMPEIPILIVNPNKPCNTKDVFSFYDQAYSDVISVPKHFSDLYHLIDFLRTTRNDLYEPALHIVPEIKNVLHSLDSQDGSLFSRMSGSGASCFGLFESAEHCDNAAQQIQNENPDWHVFAATLNSPERY